MIVEWSWTLELLEYLNAEFQQLLSVDVATCYSGVLKFAHQIVIVAPNSQRRLSTINSFDIKCLIVRPQAVTFICTTFGAIADACPCPCANFSALQF